MKAFLGGTFDPVHIGHLIMAEEAAELLNAPVALLPCYQAVHKSSVCASARQRHEMLELAASLSPLLYIDDRELRRSQPSFMIDSLKSLRLEFPDQPLVLVMGVDAYRGLSAWKSVHDFANYCHILVMHRPEASTPDALPVPEKIGFSLSASVVDLSNALKGLCFFHRGTQIDVSSSQLRECLRNEQSIRFRVPSAVEQYICDNAVYRSDGG